MGLFVAQGLRQYATACRNAVMSSRFPMSSTADDHPSPASAGESPHSLQLAGCHLVAPIPADDGRKAMKLSLRFPPLSASQSVLWYGTQYSPEE